MITRNIIEITNHPLLTDITRKVQIFRSGKEYDSNRVILKVKVSHYKNGEEIEYFPKYVELIVDNITMVNPSSGAIVQPDAEGQYPAGSIGEYDYLWDVVNVAKTYTEAELEEIYIPLRISQINTKLYI